VWAVKPALSPVKRKTTFLTAHLKNKDRGERFIGIR
jgi:hypothetical protein